MTMKRIAFLCCLAAAFLYYIFDSRYFSWVLFIMCLGIPLVSFLLTLPTLFRRRALINCYQTTGHKENPAIIIKLNQPVSFSPVWLNLHITNQFYGRVSKQKLMINPGCEKLRTALSVEENCGVYQIHPQQIWIRDLLGFIKVPLFSSSDASLLTLPEEMPFLSNFPIPCFSTGPLNNPAIQADSGEREWKDVRNYQPGDPLRDVHWKLSARFGTLMLREYENSAESLIVLAVCWNGSPDDLSRLLSRFIGLIRFLFAQQLSCSVLWIEPGSNPSSPAVQSHMLNQWADFEQLCWSTLSRPPSCEHNFSVEDCLSHLLGTCNNILIVSSDAITCNGEIIEQNAAQDTVQEASGL